jgi:type III secretory pathway component EscV
MMALQMVEGVIQLALGGKVPLHLDYTQLADHLVAKLAPRAAASVISADVVTSASLVTGMPLSLLPVEVKLYSEVEELRKRSENQDKQLKEQKKIIDRMQEQINTLALKDSDHNVLPSSGLVLALRNSKQSETRTVQDLEKSMIQMRLQLEELRNACLSSGILLETPRIDDHARAKLFSPTSPPEENWK